jgi:hypothetical protein
LSQIKFFLARRFTRLRHPYGGQKQKKTKTKDLSQRLCLPMLLDSSIISSISHFNSLPHQL